MSQNIGPVLVLTTVTWVQTVVTLSAAASAQLLPANSKRRALRWMNIGANPMTVAPGTAAAVVGQGMQYNGAADVGMQGGADMFVGVVSTQAFQAISTLGTTVIVWEGL